MPIILHDLAFTYWFIGFSDKAEYYANELATFSGDSISYYQILSGNELFQVSIETAYNLSRTRYDSDSTNLDYILQIGNQSMYLMRYLEARQGGRSHGLFYQNDQLL